MHRIHSGAKFHAYGRTTGTPPTYAQHQHVASTYPPGAQGSHAVPGPAPARPPTQPATTTKQQSLNEKNNVHANDISPSSSNETPDVKSEALPPPAPPPNNTKDEGSQSAAITSEKPSWPQRATAGSKRFVNHTKDAIFHSWLNVLLIFVPVGIAVAYAPLPESSKPTIVFAMNAVAIIPLAGLLAHATESVASRMGDTWASLLNVTFGNAVELIIFILALSKDQIQIVQASILGSILANLLLILGMAFALGGLRYREQLYNSTVTQMSAVLLALAVTSLLLPTAFHASFSNLDTADAKTLKISRGTSIVLLLVYALYLLFQLKSHTHMYKSTPQHLIDEEMVPGVLAGMMDSSSDSSSSSSSDSDDSTGSHITATKRMKRALRRRRRRSVASSTIASSSAAISSPSSPSNEGNSIPDSATPPRSSYFHRHGRDTNASALVSDDEADTDGEHERGEPRVRDFQDEKDGKSRRNSIFSKHRKHRKHAKRDKRSKKSTKPDLIKDDEMTESPQPLTDETAGPLQGAQDSQATTPHVGFATNNDLEAGEPGQQQNTKMSPRRPFAITRPSMLKPALPNVFANTVFSTPAPAPIGTTKPDPLSIARGHQLHRTNSLPDRLNRQNSKQPAAVLPVTPGRQASGAMVMNEADGIAKDHAEDDAPPPMSRTAAVMLLLCSTGLVAFCAELLVDAIPDMIGNTGVSEAFVGLIILPIVGNAAEHVTAVAVAMKNKMDLALGIALGSSIQIALFITPIVVLLGWILDKDMSLLFTLFETVSLFVTVFVVNFLVLDGRSNYLEGSLLIAAYVLIAVCAYFYPATRFQSSLGGGPNP